MHAKYLMALPVCFGLGASALARPNSARSIHDSPAIVDLMDTLDNQVSASGGFDIYEGEAIVRDNSVCQDVDGSEVVQWLEIYSKQSLREVYPTDAELTAYLAPSLRDLSSIVGEGAFRHCRTQVVGSDYRWRYNSFASLDSDYKLTYAEATEN
jgi:hypothetical protein